MNPEQLWETTMDPEKRTLVNVTLEDAVEAEKLVVTLMGDDINARKEYINKHANFNRVDEFMKKISKYEKILSEKETRNSGTTKKFNHF